jgi:hypothetical protein
MNQLPDKWLKGYARQDAMQEFASQLRELADTIGFKVSGRGWCYLLEEHGLLKGDFDRAQKVINQCRKNGLLPVGFTADDGARATKHVEELTGRDESEIASYIVDRGVGQFIRGWEPTSLWENQEYYCEVAVEKIDLVTLFQPICEKYHVPLTNFRGWSDINSRAAMMNRFEAHENEGRRCILLYCGDHDPGGLNISTTLRTNLEQLGNADGVGWFPDEIEVVRFGLNHDFIEANNLSWIDNLETSSGARLDNPRHKDHYKPYVQNYIAQFGVRKVEANALVTRPDAVRKLMRDTLREYIDFDLVDEFESEMEDRRTDVEDRVMDLMKEKYGNEE